MRTVLAAFNARFSHSSLAVRYIKEYNSDLDIKIMEFSINENIFSSYSALLAERADIYCFSVYIWNIETAARAAEMLKKALPECVIVFGGPECSYNTKESFEKYPFLDYITVGEGEIPTGNLIRSLESGQKSNPPGIASPDFPDAVPVCVPLESVPFPYTEKSVAELENKIVYFETSRGCPFRCSYCLSAIEKSVRYFPMEYVKRGFDFFFKHGIPLVKLVDRTFNADPKRAAEIIKYIIKNSKCTKVHFEIDPGILTEDLILLLASAPKDLFQLEMGIQSSNEETLKAIKRHENLTKVSENIKRLKNARNMHIHLDLIAGLPYEDYESFEKSFNYVYSLRPDMLQLGFLKVLHGAPIKDFGGIVYADFPPYEVIKTKWISAEEICRLKLIDKAVDEINNSGAFGLTLGKITKENPFKAFERLSDIFRSEKKPGRFELYGKIYEIYGAEVFKELIFDFMLNSRTRPMPHFADIKYPEGFKKLCAKILSVHFPYLNPEDVRFEPIEDKIFMADIKNSEVLDVTALAKAE